MHILITGGAGYIGSHMVHYLLEQGYSLSVFDNLSTGHIDSLPPAINFFQGDLLREEDLNRCFAQLNKVHAVMHFAGLSIVSESIINPTLYYQQNYTGTANLLAAMRSYDIKNIIFSSTAAVYGVPETIPIPVSHKTEPINPYGQTKLMAENLLKEYAKNYHFNAIALRYFNAAGAGVHYGLTERHQPETHLIPLLMQAALKGHEVTVYGNDYDTPDGSCIRDYIHVLDVCEAHLLALNTLDKLKSFNAYNIGTERGASVLELIKIAEHLSGQPIQTKIATRRTGDPPILIAGSQLTKQVLGWQPKHSQLEQIIHDTWQSIKNMAR